MSTFQKPLKVRDNRGDSVGNVVLSQTALLNFDATLVQTVSFKVPEGAQLVAFFADTLTAFNSLTSATLSIGSAAAGTQYASGVDVKTDGREAPTLTAAQLAAMDDVGTNTTVYATVTSVGQPTAGQVRITVQYVAA